MIDIRQTTNIPTILLKRAHKNALGMGEKSVV
jgi:hypothetical protein